MIVAETSLQNSPETYAARLQGGLCPPLSNNQPQKLQQHQLQQHQLQQHQPQKLQNQLQPQKLQNQLQQHQSHLLFPIGSRPKWRSDDDQLQTLRHRLDQLQYPQYLDKSSMDLVQQLLADLVQTTDTARSLQSQLDLVTLQVQTTDDQIHPLRREIARLTSENNHLHRDLIHMADERDVSSKRTTDAARLVDSQTADLRFMASQYQHRVVEEQRKLEDTRAKVEGVLGRIGRAPGVKATNRTSKTSNTMSTTEKMFQRLQKIDIETGLEPIDPSYMTCFVPPDPVIGDMVRLAEGQIESLTQANKEIQSKNTDLENELHISREQLSKREREILRLSTQLEVSRSQQFGAPQNITSTTPQPRNGHAASSSPSKTPASRIGTSRTAGIVDIEAAKDRIEQLEIQIEYLQEHIDGLEKELVNLEKDREVVQAVVVDERDQLSEDLKTERERTKELLINLTHLERMVNEIDINRPGFPASKTVNAKSSSLPISKHLKQISELTDKVNTTQQKLERTTLRLNTISKEKQKVEQELVALKKIDSSETTRSDKNKDVEKCIPSGATGSNISKLHVSKDKDVQIQELQSDLVNLKLQLDRSTSLQKELHASSDELSTLKANLGEIEKERATAISRLTLTTEKLAHAEQYCTHVIDNQQAVLEDLTNTQRERDDLLRALENFGSQVTELHDRVQLITADRDNMAQLYAQVNHEIQLLRSHDSKSTQQKTTSASNTILPNGTSTASFTAIASATKNVNIPTDAPAATQEGENETPIDIPALQTHVEELKAEIVKLQADLEATVMRHKETGAASTEAISQLEVEITRLKSSLDSSEESNQSLQNEIQSLTQLVDGHKEDKKDLLRDLERLRIRLTQLEIDHEKDQYLIRDLRSKVSEAEATMLKLDKATVQLRTEATDREALLSDQMKLIADIDKERDGFQTDLDKKAELITDLTDQLNRLSSESANTFQEITTIREQLDLASQNLTQQDRELNSLQHQLDQTIQERDHLGIMAQRHSDESRNLGSDLAAVTRENQVLNAELVESTVERDRYKAEVVECDRQLRYLDELIRGKDQEKDQIMASYRKLISEHERLDIALQSVSEEGDHVKMEVIMRDKRVEQLQKAFDESSLQLNQYKIDLGAFEKQCNNMGRTLATSERTIKHLESERTRMNRDVAVARDLAHTLERQNTETQAQHQAVVLENDRLSRSIERMNSEFDALMSKMNAEKSRTERLEQLAANERTHKMKMERSLMDMQATKGSISGQTEKACAQHLATIATLSKAAIESRDEIKACKSRIENLESHLRDQQSALASSDRDLMHSKEMFLDLQKRFEEKKRQLREIVELRQETTQINMTMPPGQTDAFDQRVAQEILSAKIAQSRYEKRIAKRSMQHEASELDRRLGETSSPIMGESDSMSGSFTTGDESEATHDTTNESKRLETDGKTAILLTVYNTSLRLSEFCYVASDTIFFGEILMTVIVIVAALAFTWMPIVTGEAPTSKPAASGHHGQDQIMTMSSPRAARMPMSVDNVALLDAVSQVDINSIGMV
ncbi:hypothetical protein BASA83_011775 [Batrachochytrium salamandrivorans]|nr:hypothetical protein BASA62_007989 [Batrachochytrium salamandrivorans]KAH9264741.1 hypothetical protein BASA83_011775 [Batrachochytrium salamandrivorans]